MKQVLPSEPAGRNEDLAARRPANLRQLLLRAARATNRDVVAGLRALGYADLRSTHTTLLSNMDLAGESITAIADRAGISKQAMGRLASELEGAGYLRIEPDPTDARARRLTLTQAGQRLMHDSLTIMAELERGYAKLIGEDRFAATLGGLSALVAAAGMR